MNVSDQRSLSNAEILEGQALLCKNLAHLGASKDFDHFADEFTIDVWI